MPKYQDFVLTLSGKPGEYTVEARGGGGVQVDPVHCAYAETPEIRLQFERIQMGYAPTLETMKLLGGCLYQSLFPQRIADSLRSMEGKLPRGTSLRLKLNIRPPELRDLPWEFLYDPEDDVFLANLLSSPVVRFIAGDQPVESTVVSSPLKILYVQSSPQDTPELDMLNSEQSLRDAWGKRAEVFRLPAANLQELQNALRQPYHILHYDGHAGFDPERNQGFLIMADDGNRRRDVYGETLATFLNNTTIRLVVLTACKTAEDASQKRYAGLAQQLMVRNNLPAVVAMQFNIQDEAAIAFIQGFYSALADGFPIDAAVVEGRKAILGKQNFDESAWATPVLFMRSEDGDIFADQGWVRQSSDILARFRTYHAILAEWKTLHSSMDNLIQNYEQFQDQVNRVLEEDDNKRRLREITNLQANNWMPISNDITRLLVWAKSVQYIGPQLQLNPDRTFPPDSQLESLESQQRDISGYIQDLSTYYSNLSFGFMPARQPTDAVARMSDKVSRLKFFIFQLMNFADENIRSTVSALIEESGSFLKSP